MNIDLSTGRVLEVLVTLVYGVVIGTWIPTPNSDAPATLPAIRAAAPAPQLLERTRQEDASAQLVWTETGSTLPPFHGAALPTEPLSGQSSVPSAMDTLPAAPTIALALPGPAAGVTALDSRASVIRIGGGQGTATAPRAVTSSDRCAAVISDGSDADPFGCRGEARRRREALCPKPGGPGHQGTVICIRSPE
jgi:hypothetical protein